MPFKFMDDKRKHDREYMRVVALDRFKNQGLEPVNANDTTSELSCIYCGRVSSRNANKIHRHYEGCFKNEK